MKADSHEANGLRDASHDSHENNGLRDASRSLKHVQRISALGSSDDHDDSLSFTAAASAGWAHHHSRPWYILLPSDRLTIGRDAVVFAFLCIIFFVIPFEVAFVDAGPFPDPSDGLWIFNRVTDVIFLADMFVQFFVACPKLSDELEFEDGMLQAGQLETRLWPIFLNCKLHTARLAHRGCREPQTVMSSLSAAA